MGKRFKKVLIFGLSIIMLATTMLVGGLFINKNNDNEFSDGSSNDVSQETTPINPIYYASPTEATGASEADKSKKGSLIYVESGATVTISDNVNIGGSLDKKYGGAVYVEAGGTFNMTGGTISGCSSKLGGAIYVEAGGTFNMTGGTISENSAELGAAIYVEPDGIVNISGSSEIINNIEGEWGYLEFDGVKYRDFDHFYNTFDVSKYNVKNGFTYNIYGTVYHDYKVLNSDAYENGLNFGKNYPVKFIGSYNENITDLGDVNALAADAPTIVAGSFGKTDATYQSTMFNAEGSNFTIQNIIFEDQTKQTSSWETWYIKPKCNNLYISGCTFNEGLNVCETTTATINSTTFNSKVSGHYSLWIGANGRYAYRDYIDNIESCVVNNCTFTGYRAIKILSSEAHISLNSVDFKGYYEDNVELIEGLSQKHAIVAEDVDNSTNTISFSNINFYNCAKGFIDVYDLGAYGKVEQLESTVTPYPNLYFDLNRHSFITNSSYQTDNFESNDGGDYYLVSSDYVNYYEKNIETEKYELVGFWYGNARIPYFNPNEVVRGDCADGYYYGIEDLYYATQVVYDSNNNFYIYGSDEELYSYLYEGHLIFDDLKYRDFIHFYQKYNDVYSQIVNNLKIDPNAYDNGFIYEIYGKVYHDYKELYSDAFLYGLNFQVPEDFSGQDDTLPNGNIGNIDVYIEGLDGYFVDKPTIVIDGVYQSMTFSALESTLTFNNIIFNDERTSQTSSWETWYVKPICNDLIITNCIFNEGLQVREVTTADISGTIFNSIKSGHYSLWIGATGITLYNNDKVQYIDNITECIISGCTFTGYRALKVLSNGANIKLSDVDFGDVSLEDLSQKHAIVAEDINIDGVFNTFEFSNVNIVNWSTGFVDIGDLGVLSGDYIQYYYVCEHCGYKGVGFISGHDFPDDCPNCHLWTCPICKSSDYVEKDPDSCPDCGWPICPTCGHINNREDTSCEKCNYPNEQYCDHCGEYLYADGSCSNCWPTCGTDWCAGTIDNNNDGKCENCGGVIYYTDGYNTYN